MFSIFLCALCSSLLVSFFLSDFHQLLSGDFVFWLTTPHSQIAHSTRPNKVIPIFHILIPRVIHNYFCFFFLSFCYFSLVYPFYPPAVDNYFLYLFSLLCLILGSQDFLAQAFATQHFLLLSSPLLCYTLVSGSPLLVRPLTLFYGWLFVWVIHSLLPGEYFGEGDFLFGCILSLYFRPLQFFFTLFFASSCALLSFYSLSYSHSEQRYLPFSLSFLPYFCSASLLALFFP